MIKLIYNPKDTRYIYIYGDNSELQSQLGKPPKKRTPNLEDFLNKIPQYEFLPSFRGIPKPECFLHKFRMKDGMPVYHCHSGLWKTIYDWCNTKHIKLELPGNFDQFKYTGFNMPFEEFREYVNSWEISLCPYEYQLKAAWLILHYRQSLSQLATRAGKTLISYIVFRYLTEQMGAHKILMIVPAKALVKQAVEDYAEYAEFFKMETVWAGGELQEGSNFTVGTFQSLVKKADKKSSKYDPHFFDDYDAVLVDEAHTLKCDSINKILEQPFMKNVKIKFGFTGSLPDENTIDSFCCHALMGPTIQDIRAKELMDGGYITPVNITQIYINHPECDELNHQYVRCGEYLCSTYDTDDSGNKIKLPAEEQEFTIIEKKTLPLVLKEMKKDPEVSEKEYRNYLVDLCKDRGSNLLLLEQMLVHRNQKRVDIINDLLSGFEKNCIVYFHHTEYGRFLYNYFKEKFPDRPMYIIIGRTSDKKREDIKKKLLNDKGAILFASYGCCSTGLTFKNLDYGIFAQSFKSGIVNRQAVGRGLCLANDKEYYYLYDLVDCFPTGKLEEQGRAKLKLFKKEKFEHCVEKR